MVMPKHAVEEVKPETAVDLSPWSKDTLRQACELLLAGRPKADVLERLPGIEARARIDRMITEQLRASDKAARLARRVAAEQAEMADRMRLPAARGDA